nr:hypothetical protein [Tanacetum cinerariifolium]
MCGNYKRYGHPTKDCWVNNNNNNNNNKNQKSGACYEYGDTGHIKKNYPKLKNRENGNRNGVAQGRAYALGGGDSNLKSNTVTGTFLLNNRYASILFDTGTDRSFVSTAFSALLNIAPSTLDNHYDVELADGKIIGVNTILRCCTCGLLDNIHGNVMYVRPKTLDETIELGNDLMDQTLCTYAERQNDNKRKADDSSRNNQQQQPYVKQNVTRAYTAYPGEKRDYTGNLPLCT